MTVVMSEDEKSGWCCNRRRFLIRSAAVFGTGAIALLLGRNAYASGLSPLSMADPEAKELHYIDDASKIDRSSNPSYIPGSKCARCSFFRANGATGTCAFFPGKSVNANGWCSAYSQTEDAE